MKNGFSHELFEKIPIIGILRNIPGRFVQKIAELYFKTGFSTLEITLNSKDAIKSISLLSELFNDKGNIGAGTVRSPSDLESAIDAGAEFIVTPIVNESVIRKAVEENIPIFAGAYTPTEIYRAWELGATGIKVFPSEFGGWQYIRAIKQALEIVPLIPTGGVSKDNIKDYFQAGCKAVGMGSQLFPSSLVQCEDWQGLEKLMIQTLESFMQISVGHSD